MTHKPVTTAPIATEWVVPAYVWAGRLHAHIEKGEFSIARNLLGEIETDCERVVAESKRVATQDEILIWPIAKLDMGVRINNALEERGILTIEDLLCTKREELAVIPNVSKSTIETIYTALEKVGFARNVQGCDVKADSARGCT